MPYLVRKVTRAKWDRRDGLAENEIPADAVTSDLRTTNNSLSFWKCDTSSNGEIRITVLALATAADRIDRMDLVWLEENLLRKHRIRFIRSEGRTPLASVRNKHTNVERLDLKRLSKVAELLAQSLDQGHHRRFTKNEVVEIVVEAVRQDLISLSQLQPKVKIEVEKVIAG